MRIADPTLAPLADNGGGSTTHALLAGSPAINAGTSCSVTVDQRYGPRDAQCDVGAFEFIDFTTVTLTIDPSAAINPSNGWTVLTGTVTCTRDETFNLAVELQQVQRVGRDTTEVHSAGTVPVTCATGVRPWSASTYLTSRGFKAASAQATAGTMDTPWWVTATAASSEVKLYWGRR